MRGEPSVCLYLCKWNMLLRKQAWNRRTCFSITGKIGFLDLGWGWGFVTSEHPLDRFRFWVEGNREMAILKHLNDSQLLSGRVALRSQTELCTGKLAVSTCLGATVGCPWQPRFFYRDRNAIFPGFLHSSTVGSTSGVRWAWMTYERTTDVL